MHHERSDLHEIVELERLMDELSVSDRHLDLAAGNGDIAAACSGGGSSNPGVNCTGGCN
jgi:hypothetical protein